VCSTLLELVPSFPRTTPAQYLELCRPILSRLCGTGTPKDRDEMWFVYY
jgi:hypothetical protein